MSVSDAGSGTGTETVSTTKLRMYNKLSALDKIAKHIGFYKPEIRLPDKEYIYLTDKEINSYDCFDNDNFVDDEEEVKAENSEEAVDVPEAVNGPVAVAEPVVCTDEAVEEKPAAIHKEPIPYIPHLSQPNAGRFRGAIAMPKRELTDEELLHASLNKALKSYDAKNYVNLSVTQKTRLLWRLRKFE